MHKPVYSSRLFAWQLHPIHHPFVCICANTYFIWLRSRGTGAAAAQLGRGRRRAKRAERTSRACVSKCKCRRLRVKDLLFNFKMFTYGHVWVTKPAPGHICSCHSATCWMTCAQRPGGDWVCQAGTLLLHLHKSRKIWISLSRDPLKYRCALISI